MTQKPFDRDIDNYSISTAHSSDTITITVNGDEVDLNEQLNISVNKTPSDPMEEAELILAGICPKCRQDNGAHDWQCPDWASDLGIPEYINMNHGFPGMATTYGPNITPDPTIHVGNNTLTQEKLDKLDALLDRFDDLDLDKLIKFMDKLPDE